MFLSLISLPILDLPFSSWNLQHFPSAFYFHNLICPSHSCSPPPWPFPLSLSFIKKKKTFIDPDLHYYWFISTIVSMVIFLDLSSRFPHSAANSNNSFFLLPLLPSLLVLLVILFPAFFFMGFAFVFICTLIQHITQSRRSLLHLTFTLPHCLHLPLSLPLSPPILSLCSSPPVSQPLSSSPGMW